MGNSLSKRKKRIILEKEPEEITIEEKLAQKAQEELEVFREGTFYPRCKFYNDDIDHYSVPPHLHAFYDHSQKNFYMKY